MTQYGVIQAIFMSFYSKKLYRDVAIHWGGKAWLYLFFILALSWISASYQLQQTVNESYFKYAPVFVNQIPELTIHDGVVSTPENKPYLINDPDTHETIAIIDTTGQYSNIGTVGAPLLITQTEVFTRPRSNEIKTNKIPSNINVQIKPKSIDAFIGALVGYVGVVFFIVILFNSYLFRLTQAHLYAIIGKFFNFLCHSELQYPQVLQIVMVALTPVIVISSVLGYLDIKINYEWTLYCLLTLLYILYGVRANKKPKQSLTTESQAST